MGPEFFQIEIDSGVARCTMRGPKMNAMGADMLFPMLEGLKEVGANDEVRVIVLRGDGGNFTTGADLSIMGEKMEPILLRDTMFNLGDMIIGLHEGPKPVIAEVDGWAVGGGFGLALSSDITYATERAKFLLSFVRISLIPDLGGSYFLAQRAGIAQAKELALTGKVVDAEEAFRLGLVNQIIPHEEISQRVMEVARQMATRPTKVLAMIKRNINIARNVDLRTLLELEANAQAVFVTCEEHQRDVEDFFKKAEK